MHFFQFIVLKKNIDSYKNPCAEPVGIVAETCNVFNFIPCVLSGTELRTGNIYGIGTAVYSSDADVSVPRRSQKFQKGHFLLLNCRNLLFCSLKILGIYLGRICYSLLIILLGLGFIVELLISYSDTEKNVSAVLCIRREFQEFLEILDGLLVLAAISGCCSGKLVCLGAFYVLGRFESIGNCFVEILSLEALCRLLLEKVAQLFVGSFLLSVLNSRLERTDRSFLIADGLESRTQTQECIAIGRILCQNSLVSFNGFYHFLLVEEAVCFLHQHLRDKTLGICRDIVIAIFGCNFYCFFEPGNGFVIISFIDSLLGYGKHKDRNGILAVGSDFLAFSSKGFGLNEGLIETHQSHFHVASLISVDGAIVGFGNRCKILCENHAAAKHQCYDGDNKLFHFPLFYVWFKTCCKSSKKCCNFVPVSRFMSIVRRLLVLSLFFLASYAGVRAQNLPTIKQLSGITSGRFPGGISYYIIPSTSSKGYANFALVQKGAGNQEDMRAGLNADFLSSKGIGYTRDGYVSYSGSSAIFNFEDVPAFQSVALDSAIVVLFDLAARYKGEQAVIVSGDIDAAKIKDRFYLMSLTVGKRVPFEEATPYEWSPSPSIRIIHYQNSSRNLSEIRFSYASPRTPQKYMNTPQPLVSEMYARLFGYILRKRLESSFASRDIPLAYVNFGYIDSSLTPADEQYYFDIGVAESDLEMAAEAVSEVLANLDENGVSPDEFFDAKVRFLTWTQKNVAERISNKEYVALCVSNYLYGANMISRQDVANFFRGRKIAPERDLSLFNRFVSALLDPERNLTVTCGSPSDTLDPVQFRKVFLDSWKASDVTVPYQLSYNDTLALFYPANKKLRVRNEDTEPLTGGKLWTFSNGMRVVFKKTDESGIRYSMMTRGGFSEVPGIAHGESAFVGDMLGLYDICGMGATRFRNMLEANGITMNCAVSVSDMRISGTAPSSKLNLLFRSLLSIHKNRNLNLDTFDYYKRSEALRQEALRLSPDGVNAVMDSIMCPDYYFPETKLTGALTDSLPTRAEEYFAAQFLKCNDGVLFIEGNLDEIFLKKYLCRIIGNFKTGRTFSVRPKITYQLRSGMSTYSVDHAGRYIGNGESSANLAMAAIRPFTIQSWCAFRIAMVALKSELVREMAPLGYSFEITPQLQLIPVEKVSVFINCRPCPPEGLPVGIVPADPFEVMNVLRDAMQKIGETSVSASNMKGYKAALANEMAGELADPDYVMEAFLRRSAEGKDMVSNYSAYLSKVTSKDVSEVLSALERGSRVEFVIK